MVPRTRYARTPGGGYIAYMVLGDGGMDAAMVAATRPERVAGIVWGNALARIARHGAAAIQLRLTSVRSRLCLATS